MAICGTRSFRAAVVSVIWALLNSSSAGLAEDTTAPAPTVRAAMEPALIELIQAAAALSVMPKTIDEQTIVSTFRWDRYARGTSAIAYWYAGHDNPLVNSVRVSDNREVFGRGKEQIIEIQLDDHSCVSPELVSEITGLRQMENLEWGHQWDPNGPSEWRFLKSGVKFPTGVPGATGMLVLPYGPAFRKDGIQNCYQTIRIEKVATEYR